MLSPAFRKKVHMIPEEKLGNFLQPGFELRLPDEFNCGHADVPALVEDFITFRKHVEESSLDRAGKAMNVALPTWSPSKNKADTKQQRRRGRRPSSGMIPLSKSHAEREKASSCSSSAELDNDDDNNKKKKAPTTFTQHPNKRSGLANSIPISSWSRLKSPWESSTHHSKNKPNSAIPISSWSRMKNPWEEDDGNDHDDDDSFVPITDEDMSEQSFRLLE